MPGRAASSLLRRVGAAVTAITVVALGSAATVIGLTAGASAPPSLAQATLDQRAQMGPLQIQEADPVAVETIIFGLPQPVRAPRHSHQGGPA
ncbi:hypothetical protein [Streptomyces sp. I05A-00742]|uniref:hypothetical protein n=1 Tax=Streptomyces sp. I05A-00742 TaxID=2732853 RepID=UPI001488F763|nr:hypothetical protein [Streptomyces sp. I05A-00742]